MNSLQNCSFAVEPIDFVGEYGKQTCSYTHATTSLKMFNEDLGKIYVCSKNINHVYAITDKEEKWIRKKMITSEQGQKINIKSKDGKVISSFENMIVPVTVHKIKNETHRMVCLGCLHGKKKRVPVEMVLNCISVEHKVERRKKQKKKERQQVNKKQSTSKKKAKPVLQKKNVKPLTRKSKTNILKSNILKSRNFVSDTVQHCEKIICTRIEGTCCSRSKVSQASNVYNLKRGNDSYFFAEEKNAEQKRERIHTKTQQILKECYYNGIVIPCGKMAQKKKQVALLIFLLMTLQQLWQI